MAQSSIVNISNLAVNYGSQRALEGVCLGIEVNDFVAIVGPNGGGKSTLVKAILGLVSYSGTISFEPELRAKGAIGYLPQQNNFDRAFPISVEELVLSGLQSDKCVISRYTADDKALTKAILEQLGIADLARKAVGELSGGELQRALLGRAIISRPKLLILDEPTNFVDKRFEEELYALLEQLREEMAIVVVSHDIRRVVSRAKSVVVVNRTATRYAPDEFAAMMADGHYPTQPLSHNTVLDAQQG